MKKVASLPGYVIYYNDKDINPYIVKEIYWDENGHGKITKHTRTIAKYCNLRSCVAHILPMIY